MPCRVSSQTRGPPESLWGWEEERSNKYTDPRAAPWGSGRVMGKGGVWAGLELRLGKDELGVGLELSMSLGWDGAGLGVVDSRWRDENGNMMVLGL